MPLILVSPYKLKVIALLLTKIFSTCSLRILLGGFDKNSESVQKRNNYLYFFSRSA